MAITDVILDDKDELTLPANPADYIYILRQVAGGGFSITDYKINVRNLLGDALPYSSDGLVPDPAAGTQYFNTATGQMRGYDGSIWYNMFNAATTTKVTLSAAQMLAIYTTPIELIAAPGAGKIIELISVSARNNFNTTAFDVAHASGLHVGTLTGTEAQGSINQAFCNSASSLIESQTINAGATIDENEAISVWATVSDPTVGDGTIDVYITYRTVTL